MPRSLCMVVLVLIGLGLAPVARALESPRAAATPLEAMPFAPVVDPSALDRSVDPCVDFYQYACGGWMQNNPIPPDQSSWGTYDKLQQDVQRFLWGILIGLSDRQPSRTASQQKIGDFFAACMDEPRVAALGVGPVQPELERIAGLRHKRELPALLGQLHRDSGANVFFDLSPGQDPDDSQRMIALASAAGLSLPDRDYYLRRDQRSITLRRQFVEHVAQLLTLAGSAAPDARRQAAAVLSIETQLAIATLPTEDTRDPYRMVHKVELEGLARLTPDFNWPAYLEALGLDWRGTFNVTEPRFVRQFEHLVHARPLAELRAYLRWHVLHNAAPLLAPQFVEADFEFYDRTLLGVPQLTPRWQRCVNLVDVQLGDALGEEFVARALAPETKAQVARMTTEIEAAMESDLTEISWMSATTRRAALAKLHSVTNKIGYPDRWRRYDGVEVSATEFFANVERTTQFENRRQMAKIGRPVDHTEWEMTAPTVNAYYSEQMNDINFPAGVLEPPLFDPHGDAAANFGATGATIGHELTHGFDDEGRKYDAQGNLRDWWSKHDAQQFDQRAQCVVVQFGNYEVLDGLRVNGKLTAGENIADLGGLVLAWRAWRAHSQDVQATPIDGLSPEQRFFVADAQGSCSNQREENLRMRVLSDVHAPDKFRVNGPFSNLPEFSQAFSCHAGQPMVAARPCRIW